MGFYLYWKICEYFRPKTVLEIGLFEGLTFGLMFESTDSDATYMCVDRDLTPKKHFDTLFGNDPKYDSITFVETDSKHLSVNQKFDLVHIDGNHSYDYVKNDLEKVLPLLHDQSILIMDDTTKEQPDVARVIDEYLLGQHGFVPFLAGSREMFFHKSEHDAGDFLDNFLVKDSSDIMTFFNYNYRDFTILQGHVANFFNDNPQIFFDQLKKYNL